MELFSIWEGKRTTNMHEEAYFNSVYDDTYQDLLKFIIVKTNQADQVDDILQNTYQKFYMRILKKGFKDIHSPKAFLLKLAQRELAKHYKRKSLKTKMETDLDDRVEQIEADEVEFTQFVENKDTLDVVRNFVMQMPLISYKSFVLFYYYDMSIASIAKQLDISTNNVKNRLWRARNEVRKGLIGDHYVK